MHCSGDGLSVLPGGLMALDAGGLDDFPHLAPARHGRFQVRHADETFGQSWAERNQVFDDFPDRHVGHAGGPESVHDALNVLWFNVVDVLVGRVDHSLCVCLQSFLYAGAWVPGHGADRDGVAPGTLDRVAADVWP